MFRTVLALSLLFVACSSPKTNKAAEGFNGFVWGTPVDSIVYVTGVEPDERRIDRVRYERGTFEGIPGNSLTYVTPGGRLKSAVFFRWETKPQTADSLIRVFTNRYGTPAKDTSGANVWRTERTELKLLFRNGDLMVAGDRLTP